MEGCPLIRTERHRLTRMEGRHLINMGHHLNPTDGGRIHTTLVRGALSCYPPPLRRADKLICGISHQGENCSRGSNH